MFIDNSRDNPVYSSPRLSGYNIIGLSPQWCKDKRPARRSLSGALNRGFTGSVTFLKRSLILNYKTFLMPGISPSAMRKLK